MGRAAAGALRAPAAARAQSGEQLADRLHVEGGKHVELGHRRSQLGLVTGDEAAIGGNPSAACVSRLAGLKKGVDRLLLGGVDEPAGVDEDEVGRARRRDPVPGPDQGGLETVGIGLVLGAAESDDGEARGERRGHVTLTGVSDSS